MTFCAKIIMSSYVLQDHKGSYLISPVALTPIVCLYLPWCLRGGHCRDAGLVNIHVYCALYLFCVKGNQKSFILRKAVESLVTVLIPPHNKVREGGKTHHNSATLSLAGN